MEEQKKLVIIMEESVFKSFIKDAMTFCLFAGLLWFNHRYLSGSLLIDMSFIILVILFLISRSSEAVFRGKPEEAINYINRRIQNK